MVALSTGRTSPDEVDPTFARMVDQCVVGSGCWGLLGRCAGEAGAKKDPGKDHQCDAKNSEGSP